MLQGESLEAFLAIVEEGHFTRAADRLGIAQSVASKRLARLEDELKARLLDRGSRNRVALTRAGELFVPEAREVLAALRRAERLGRAIGRGTAGPVRIGYVFSGAMTGLLTGLVRALRTALPELQLVLTLLDTPAQLRSLADGSLDLAIVRLRPSWPERAQEICRQTEDVVVALGEGTKLAASSFLRPADLVGQTFITPQLQEEVGLADDVRRLARVGGLPNPRIIGTGDFITAACLAAAGEGIILAPASLQNLGIAGLTFRPLQDYSDEMTLALLARPEIPPALEALLRQFAAEPGRRHRVLATR